MVVSVDESSTTTIVQARTGAGVGGVFGTVLPSPVFGKSVVTVVKGTRDFRFIRSAIRVILTVILPKGRVQHKNPT